VSKFARGHISFKTNPSCDTQISIQEGTTPSQTDPKQGLCIKNVLWTWAASSYGPSIYLTVLWAHTWHYINSKARRCGIITGAPTFFTPNAKASHTGM